MQKVKSQEGFTLIELLIVIAIIGLLASIVLVGLGSFRARGRDAKRVAELRQVQNALELYYTKCQKYPDTSGATGIAGCDAMTAVDWASVKGALTGAGIGVSSIPDDPQMAARGGDTYDYGVDDASNAQNYVLGALLEDADNPALQTDADSTVYSTDCADPVYCVQF